MTRIVAGSAKGRTLKVPENGTRPTSERVREALFSRLDHKGYIEDCDILDLYAGSGALGLEAASRGARYVRLVESSRKAADCIKRNITSTVLTAQVSVAKVETWLQGPPDRRFDLVFIDPPYALGEDELATVLTLLIPHLASDALVVVERDTRSPEPTWPEGLSLEDERSWGDTRVWSGLASLETTNLES
ncbi:16S rRNA (guanine(966)-N(2))-methyltransferase RsmD [Arcanobacterium haemolyticum]|nr:16S rRNA (guanine(966)-N(2))-methyltransferase RsmD [Arcanobacterium haemolyticum]